MEGTATALAGYLDNIGTILTSAVGWTGSCAEMIMSHPLLLVPTVIGVGMIGLNVIKRFT